MIPFTIGEYRRQLEDWILVLDAVLARGNLSEDDRPELQTDLVRLRNQLARIAFRRDDEPLV